MTDEFDFTCKCGPDHDDCAVDCQCACHCNTCGGTGRWETTTEDQPTTLVDLGPCPECFGAILP